MEAVRRQANGGSKNTFAEVEASFVSLEAEMVEKKMGEGQEWEEEKLYVNN